VLRLWRIWTYLYSTCRLQHHPPRSTRRPTAARLTTRRGPQSPSRRITSGFLPPTHSIVLPLQTQRSSATLDKRCIYWLCLLRPHFPLRHLGNVESHWPAEQSCTPSSAPLGLDSTATHPLPCQIPTLPLDVQPSLLNLKVIGIPTQEAKCAG
jgi:hypothetical protein